MKEFNKSLVATLNAWKLPVRSNKYFHLKNWQPGMAFEEATKVRLLVEPVIFLFI